MAITDDINNALLAEANAVAHANDTHTVGGPPDTINRYDASNPAGTALNVVGNAFDDAVFHTGAKLQFLYGTVADNLIVTANAPSVFVNTGSGDDVLVAASGNNVLDGGLGKNTFYAGSGQDMFIADGRDGNGTMLVENMKPGDTAVLLGPWIIKSLAGANYGAAYSLIYPGYTSTLPPSELMTVKTAVPDTFQTGSGVTATGVSYFYVHDTAHTMTPVA